MRRKYSLLSTGLLLLAFVAWMFITSPVSSIPIVIQTLAHKDPDKFFSLSMLGIGELLLIAPLIFYMVIQKINIRALIGNRVNAAQILLAALLGLLMVPSLQGLDSLISWLFSLIGAKMPDQSMLMPDSVGTMVLGMLCIGVFAGVVEEPIFRGVIQRGLAGKLGKHAAILLCAFLFAFIHMDVVGLASRFVIGAVLGYLCWESGSILPGVFTHAVYNSTILGQSLLFSKVFPNWNGFTVIPGASADANSVATWILLSVPCLLASAGVYWLFRRSTPANAAWSSKPYAAEPVKISHTLAWIGSGLAALGFTLVTAATMWLDPIIKALTKYSGY